MILRSVSKLTLFSVFLLLGLFFQHCKSDNKKQENQSSIAATAANTVRIRTEADINNLNLMVASSAYDRYVGQQIFQTFSIVDPQTMQLKPLIIKEIPTVRKVTEGANKGMLAYDFEIIEEAVWDNGSPVTGNDFIFSIKIALDPLLPTEKWRDGFTYLKDIQVDATNPRKFTVFLSQYYILGLESLCQHPIYPAYHYDAANRLGNIPLADFLDANKIKLLSETDPNLKAFSEEFKQPKYTNEKEFIVGSGPYRLENMKSGEGAVLVKKQNWWGDKAAEKNPYLRATPDKLVYRPIKDEGAVENMIKNGELDVALNLNIGKFLELKNDAAVAGKYDFATLPMTAYSHWLLNNRNPKLSDKSVRKALAHLVDYDNIITNIQKGIAKRVVGPIPPFKPYYNSEITLYDFNIAKAQQLLASAGWKDSNGDGIVDKMIKGKKTELTLNLMTSNVTEAARLTAESIKENCKKAGVNVEIQWTDLGKITPETRNGNYETALFMLSSFPGLDDPYGSYHSKSIAPAGDNRSGFSNAQADKLMVAIRTESDEAKRTALYKQLQVVLNEEAPVVFLVNPEQRYITSKRFDAVISPNRPGYYEQFFKLK